MCMHVESNQQNILIIPTQRTCAKMSLFSATRSLMSTIFQSTPRKLQFSSLIGNTIIRGQNFTFTPIGIQVRGTKMKTRQAAAKRFIPTGRGGLKRNHCGKGHLTGHMSAKRTMRLNNKVFLKGTNLKRMKLLIM